MNLEDPLVNQITTGKDPLDSLPHWRADTLVEWIFDLNHKTRTPTFRIGNGTIYVGRIIGKILFLTQLKKLWIEPMK